MVYVTEQTNYQMKVLNSWEELLQFAESAQFPSHALIVRPNNREDSGSLFKDIDTPAALEEAFNKSLRYSSNGKVWAESDMRAQYNPLRILRPSH